MLGWLKRQERVYFFVMRIWNCCGRRSKILIRKQSLIDYLGRESVIPLGICIFCIAQTNSPIYVVLTTYHAVIIAGISIAREPRRLFTPTRAWVNSVNEQALSQLYQKTMPSKQGRFTSGLSKSKSKCRRRVPAAAFPVLIPFNVTIMILQIIAKMIWCRVTPCDS